MSRLSIKVLLITCVFLSGCSFGLRVPSIEEPWERVAVSKDLELRIKERIFCETVEAIREAKNITLNGRPGEALPDSYGVQIQLSVTVNEQASLNPSVSHIATREAARVLGGALPQSITLGVNGTLSSSATTVHTSYSYYNIGRIGNPDVNNWCKRLEEPHGSSLLLHSDLGLKDYLRNAVVMTASLPSSAPASGGAGKAAKIDVFSKTVTFVVVSKLGLSPTFRLTSVTAGGTSAGLLSTDRTRTHEVIWTFGPGTNEPSFPSLQTHFTQQITQSNQQRSQITQ